MSSFLEGLGQAFREISNQLKALNSRMQSDVYETSSFLVSEYMKQNRQSTRDRAEYGFFKGLCIDTIDPYLAGEIRIFCPYFNEPNKRIDSYPFAAPISAMGGFDDSGLVWVPPAGSQVCFIFEHGYSQKAYYIGTIWNKYRGPQGNRVWSESVGPFEFDEIHDGHRKGYFHGPTAVEKGIAQVTSDNTIGDVVRWIEKPNPNDESQVFPPWNTDQYQHFDVASIGVGEADAGEVVDLGQRLTYAHIYGFKTPQKHMVKLDDGDYKCNKRWKKMEFLSSCGNWMIFKDDHIHPGGQWANPACNVPCGKGEEVDCLDRNGNPVEFVGCGHRSVFRGTARNKYFKHKNECRPYKGPGTPQNNRCELPQSGIQALSISGHTMIFDDSVEVPQGVPEWERSMEDFDFGCTNRYLGKMLFKSATGHRIELNDEESIPIQPDCGDAKDVDTVRRNVTVQIQDVTGVKVYNVVTNIEDITDDSHGSFCSFGGGPRRWRGNPEDPPNVKDGCDPICDPWKNTIHERKTGKERPRRNGILLLTATGNRVELSDDTLQPAPNPLAGPNRGITLQSTSNHTLEMIDHLNEQESPYRKECGQPIPLAKRAFVRLRTGYGLEIDMRDNFSQQECQEQFIQIRAPQKKACCGPHFVRIQEYPTCGFIMVRAAGEYFRFTEGFELIIVGNTEGCLGPSSRLLYVSDTYVTYVEQLYYNYAQMHVFFAEQFIILAAGRDCPVPDSDEKGPCLARCATDVCAVYCPIMPFLVALSPLSFSNRVLVSNGNLAQAASDGCFG